MNLLRRYKADPVTPLKYLNQRPGITVAELKPEEEYETLDSHGES